MKRILLVLTVALMMAAIVLVMATPAFADPTGSGSGGPGGGYGSGFGVGGGFGGGGGGPSGIHGGPYGGCGGFKSPVLEAPSVALLAAPNM